MAYKVAQSSLSFDSLRVFASEFDSTLISKANVKFNNLAIDSLFLIISNKQKESRLLGNKNSLIKWLKDFNKTKTTLLIYNNKGVGLGWLVNQIESISSTRLPQITDTSVLKELILSFVLQELVVEVGYKNKIDTTSSFKREWIDVEKNILLNEYVSSLLNNIPLADSSEVKNKYDNGVYNGDFAQPQQAVFSEIRHNKKDSLDRILFLLKKGETFDQLLLKYNGDIKQPITYKRGSALSQAVFNLNINEISNVVENNNGSYSLVRLEKILDPVYFGFKDVYSQIERKIIKEKQDYIKDNILNLLQEKYNFIINEKWLNF